MHLDFYYDVVCPYAYLASKHVAALARRCGATLSWKPVLLGGIFRAIGQDPFPGNAMSPPRARLNLLDMSRWAELWNTPLTMPAEHPRRSVEAMRLLVATPEDKRPALSAALYTAYWEDGADITRRDVLDPIAVAHGVDPAVIDSQFARDGLFSATSEAAELGAFGVPALVVDDQLWWGQDRLHFVEAALGGQPDLAVEPRQQGGKIRFFHDFSSPFSYLASTQIQRIADRHGAQLEWSPILLGGLFREIGTADVPLFEMNAPKRAYMARDLKDWSQWWQVPFSFPDQFPIRTVTALRVAIAAPETTPHVYRAAWADNLPIGDDAVLAEVLEKAGFDAEALLEAAQTPEVKMQLRLNTQAARDAGACGVPTFEVHRDEKKLLVWGQDRLQMVEHALQGWYPTCG